MTSAQIEIPRLKKRKKDEDKEGQGAVGLPLGLGQGGGAFSRIAAVGLRSGLASRSLLFTISEFMSTSAGIVTILGTVGALSMLSRWDMSRQRELAMADESMRAFMEDTQLAKKSTTGARSDFQSSLSIPGESDSLSYVARANGGLMAAEDGAAATAEADGSNSASFDGDTTKDAPNAGSGGDVSYGTRIQANFGKSFGELSSAAGQAKWNGVGMSGGVLKQFDKPALKLKAPPVVANLGNPMASSRPASTAARSYGTISKRVSGAFSQLRATANLSRAGSSAGAAEVGHNYASAAFEGTSAIGGAGGPIGGAGEGAGSPNGADGGNPVTFSNSSQPVQAAPVGNSDNITPWQQDVNNAISLMAVGAVLVLIASFLNKIPSLPTKILAMICAGIAAACGAGAAGIGISLIAHWHQTLQGTIFTAGGGLVTAAAAIVMAGGDKSSIKGDLTGEAGTLTTQMEPPGAGVLGGVQTPP